MGSVIENGEWRCSIFFYTYNFCSRLNCTFKTLLFFISSVLKKVFPFRTSHFFIPVLELLQVMSYNTQREWSSLIWYLFLVLYSKHLPSRLHNSVRNKLLKKRLVSLTFSSHLWPQDRGHCFYKHTKFLLFLFKLFRQFGNFTKQIRNRVKKWKTVSKQWFPETYL